MAYDYSTRLTTLLAVVASLLAVLFADDVRTAGPVETYNAVTVNMIPAGQALKIDILRWSSKAERDAVVSVLTGTEEDEASLTDLPTTGYVWPRDSGLGYSVKYARRVAMPDGGQRIILVTGRPLGAFDREPWTADDRLTEDEEFTVIEFRVDEQGNGSGTMSLTTGFSIDATAGTVALENYDAVPTLIDSVARVPKPYWARD